MQNIDRRRFLVGSGGAVLALPVLEAFAPRRAFGLLAAPPKRFVMMMHPHGRTASGPGSDGWSPLPRTGSFPASGDLSPLLAGLGPIRDEIVTINAVDNLVRHMTGDGDGHYSSSMTCLTCMVTSKGNGAPSIDFVAGQRLRASPAQRSALVFPMSAGDPSRYPGGIFFGAGGTRASVVNPDPAGQVNDLFGSVMSNQPAPKTKTLHDRLVGRRGSVLDAVAKDYVALAKQVNAADRARLEQHAAFLQNVRTQLAGGGGAAARAQGCTNPDASKYPKYNVAQNVRGDLDGMLTPLIVENLVMSLACDITRTASLYHYKSSDPTFASEFQGLSPLAGGNWHMMIHEQSNRPALIQAYQFFCKMFALLVKRLGEVRDVDGSRLLDNTLVLWVSDMGYGCPHVTFNIPVVMAGMKRAFNSGQGRHIVPAQRHSLGDLYAQALRMLGGTDQTFGQTGTVGDTGVPNIQAGYGFPGFVKASTPLNFGAIEL